MNNLYLSLLREHKVLDLLDVKRSDDYWMWISIGKALYNLSEETVSAPGNLSCGLDLWIKFSQKSEKYSPGRCQAAWAGQTDNITQGVTSIRTIMLYLKCDNLSAYNEIDIIFKQG
jgi:hypothetical protein